MTLKYKNSHSDDKQVWLIEIDGHELITSTPTLMEKEMKKVYEGTKKMSDGLMYLSEVVKRIEDHQPTPRK